MSAQDDATGVGNRFFNDLQTAPGGTPLTLVPRATVANKNRARATRERETERFFTTYLTPRRLPIFTKVTLMPHCDGSNDAPRAS